MAFAVVPYILVDILLSKSSTSKLGGFTQNEDSQSDVRVWCISPSPIGSVYAIYHPAWAFVLLIRVKGSQGLEFGISKCSACAFLWTYPEIRTCSTDDWWLSSLREKQRHTTRNWHYNGPLTSAKPTKSSSAASTPHSKKRF